MFKRRPIDRSRMCIPPHMRYGLDAPDGPAAARISRAPRVTNIVVRGQARERVRSGNERLSHHRVASVQLQNAQTRAIQPLTYVQTFRCVFSDWMHQTALQQGAKSNGYCGMGLGERVGSGNERSSHRQVASGQLQNAQTPAIKPLTHVPTFRKPRSRTGRCADGDQQGAKSNEYRRGMGSGERVLDR